MATAISFNMTPFTMLLAALVCLMLSIVPTVNAQFDFFEHMFQRQHGGGGGQHVRAEWPSDSSRYQQQWEDAVCDKYLCPGTLACVAVPHHCPCAHPAVEEKFELGEGSAVCFSKGGYKAGEAKRKIELVRKGLL